MLYDGKKQHTNVRNNYYKEIHKYSMSFCLVNSRRKYDIKRSMMMWELNLAFQPFS